MDLVEILLLGLVGLSVLFFLILDNLDPHRGSVGGKVVSSEVVVDRECRDESKEERGELDFGEEEEEFVDDWEGVERSELEKIFGEAMVFLNSKSNDYDVVGEDVKMQLYGLQRLALEGPCYGSQPMALQVSARSKWNAWNKLGNMNPEMAMEKYIDILSEAIPDWKLVNENLRSKDEDMVSSEDNINEAEVD